MELDAVIDSDRLEEVGMSADELDDTAVRGSDRAGAELADKRAAGTRSTRLTTQWRSRGLTMVSMADFLSQFDGGRPFGNVPFAGQAATLLSTTVALSPLRRLSQELKQPSSTRDQAGSRALPGGDE